MKLSSSHEIGLEALEEIADQLPLKMPPAHNEHGVLSLNWNSCPGRYELATSESLWPDLPVNHFVNGAELERETNGVNPFGGE